MMPVRVPATEGWWGPATAFAFNRRTPMSAKPTKLPPAAEAELYGEL